MKLFISGTVLSLMLLGAASCNRQMPDMLPGGEVTPELQAALYEMYPDAQDVVWSMKGAYYVATFKASAADVRSSSVDMISCSAWFDASYQWQMTETDIPQDMIPDAVWAAFDATEYADWRIDDIDMLRRGGVETIYIIEVEGTTADGIRQDVDLYFSEDGVLVKTVIDAEDDYDYSDYIPDSVPDSIEELIASMYPDARILEQDWDDGYLEVEIWHDGREKSVYFNGSDEWVWSQWDVRASELPEAVTAALQAEYPDYRIDDAEFVETPDSEYYRIELEGRGGELDVRITPEGTIF